MVQVHAKDVSKYITTEAGGLYVIITSLTKQQELLVTCSDTGRLLQRVQ